MSNSKNSNAKKYQLAVVIGRFQPFHKGHAHLLDHARSLADNVLVLVGSARCARDPKNPLTYEERVASIVEAYGTDGYLHFEGIEDYVYNVPRWIARVRLAVSDFDCARVAIVGFAKDASSEYLTYFPDYALEYCPPYLVRGEVVSATEIRETCYGGKNPAVMHGHALVSLSYIMDREALDSIRAERAYYNEYKAAWATSPYDPTFLTADSFVVQSGHILLVERGQLPGKGLWALPGGFLNGNETLLQASLRELREETCLKVPEKVLRGSIFAEGVFDDPNRSLRGRVVTKAFGYHLDDSLPLPKVKGADDAKNAMWVPIEHVLGNRHRFFEDHASIIDWFLDRLS